MDNHVEWYAEPKIFRLDELDKFDPSEHAPECEYCKTGNSRSLSKCEYDDGATMTININSDTGRLSVNLYCAHGENYYDSVKISSCPVCQRKFEVKPVSARSREVNGHDR